MSNEKNNSQNKLNSSDLKDVSGGLVLVPHDGPPIHVDPKLPNPDGSTAVVCSKCKKVLTTPDEIKNKICLNCMAQSTHY